jgi:hypothetical protein
MVQTLHHAERDDYDGGDRSITPGVIATTEAAPMQNRRFSKGIAWLGVVLLGAVAAYWLIDGAVTTLRIAQADEQTAVFEQMRDKAEEGEAEEAADCLSYTLSYYPSGTKQRRFSRTLNLPNLHPISCAVWLAFPGFSGP